MLVVLVEAANQLAEASVSNDHIGFTSSRNTIEKENKMNTSTNNQRNPVSLPIKRKMPPIAELIKKTKLDTSKQDAKKIMCMLLGCTEDSVGNPKEFTTNGKKHLAAVCASHKWCSKCHQYEISRSFPKVKKSDKKTNGTVCIYFKIQGAFFAY